MEENIDFHVYMGLNGNTEYFLAKIIEEDKVRYSVCYYSGKTLKETNMRYQLMERGQNRLDEMADLRGWTWCGKVARLPCYKVRINGGGRKRYMEANDVEEAKENKQNGKD